MKRITVFIAIILASFAAHAQNDFDAMRNRDFVFDLLHVVASITAAFLIVSFIIYVIRMFLEHRIKNKMLEKGASESIITQLLQTVNKDNRHGAIKWFFMLAGAGLGLALVDAFLPLGIHSLAIMSCSMAVAFLGYYLFTRRSDRQ